MLTKARPKKLSTRKTRVKSAAKKKPAAKVALAAPRRERFVKH